MMSLRAIKNRPWIWRGIRVWNTMDGGIEVERRSRMFYRTTHDLRELRSMIFRRMEEQAQFVPVKAMNPVAREVLQARSFVINGVSAILEHIPIVSCKLCSEVYIGKKGHLLSSCFGTRNIKRIVPHKWIKGTLNDIIVPVEAYHLESHPQGTIQHDQKSDFDRIPAVLELCWQAGANPNDPENQQTSFTRLELSSSEDLCYLASQTLNAWEALRSGVERLLLDHPSKVCKLCSQVHIGTSTPAEVCGIFKYEGWCGTHLWKKAKVDDFVPNKIVWKRRRQDPEVLVDEGRGFYGRAPAVVELCVQAGVPPPLKYHYMMKYEGLAPPPGRDEKSME